MTMSSQPTNPVFCAIDTPDAMQAAALAQALAPVAGGLKLGKEFFTALGPEGVRHVMATSGLNLFLDLKFHDIPNTVAGAVRAACLLGPYMMTIHAAGGPAMIRAAADAAMAGADTFEIDRPRIMAVTVLTSLDDGDLEATGVSHSAADQVRRLAELAQTSGADGVVCSPHEIATLREDRGADFDLIVPGIRPAGSAAGDQKRVMTPAEAMALGASHLVIGRPITQADDPAAACRDIVAGLA